MQKITVATNHRTACGNATVSRDFSFPFNFSSSQNFKHSAARKIVVAALTSLFAVGASAAEGQYVIGGTEDAPLQITESPVNFQNSAPDIEEPIVVSHVDIVKPSSSKASVVIFNSIQNQDLRFESATVQHADIRYTNSFGANVAGVFLGNGIHDFYTDFLTADDIAIDLGGTGLANAAGIMIQSSTAGQKLEHLHASGVSTTAGGSGGTTSGIRLEVAGFDAVGIEATDIVSDNINAFGIYNLESQFGVDKDVVLSSISASNAIAYGYYASNSVWNDAIMTARTVQVSDVTGGTSAYGIRIIDNDSTADDTHDQKDHAASLYATDSITVSGIHVDPDSTKGASAYGIAHQGSELESNAVSITDVLGKTTAMGFYASGKTTLGSLVIDQVRSDNFVHGIYATGQLAAVNIDRTDISNVQGTSGALVNAMNGAAVSIGSGFLTADKVGEGYQPAYQGNFTGVADSESNAIRSVAIRSVQGASVVFGNPTDSNASARASTPITIVGDIVAGRGSSEPSYEGGTVEIYGSAGSALYGDVYAGNGGSASLVLEGSTLEGQIDDYHELADGSAEASSFRNSDFFDNSGNAVDVESAGSVALTLADSIWTARGKSFVESLTFSGTSSLVDLSQNENSSVTIGTLSGSNGVFKMMLGKPEAGADGLIHSDMLYISNIDADSQNRIEVVFADGVTSFEELDGLRFATSSHVDSTKHLQLNLEDRGFFNRTLSVELEDYEKGDADNAKYNGAGNGEGSYKPGEDAVDGMFDTGDTNWIINSKSEEEPVDPTDPVISDAGQTIIGTARATYWNAVILDRWNQRYGERTYDANKSGVWARVKHERLGTDSGTGDFRSYNTMYQFGYDYAKPTENGKMIWGAAFDYMDGRTDYKSIEGDGGTDRTELSLYATYLGDNGFYGDLVIRGGKLNSDFDMVTPSGTALDADYDNWFYGLSFETGRQLENGTGWFVEPQVQMQYLRIASGDYSTAQTKVKQDAIDSLIGRAGFRVGKFLSDDKAQTVYFKADVLREFMGEQKIRVTDVTTRVGGEDVSISNHGTWFDVGAGFQAAVSKDFYAYGDVEYRFGNDLWNTWVFNVGAKYRF